VTFACKTEFSIRKDQNVLESGFASPPGLFAFGLLAFRNYFEEKKETARSVIELTCACVAIENQAYKAGGRRDRSEAWD